MSEFTPAPIKPMIEFKDLDKLDLRVGTIEDVQDVERSDKLVRLRVNFGDHDRTIFSGMKKERDDCRKLIGRQALFAVNLPPKKMMGEVSEGMILDIGYANGLLPALAQPERPVPNGARLG